MQKRLKSLDFLRGFCIIWMLFQHITLWLTGWDSFIILDTIVNIFDFLGAGAFLFASGMGITLSHRKKTQKVSSKKDLEYKQLRLRYFLKCFLLLIVSFSFNLFLYFVITNLDPTSIWIWFILQTVPVSMIIAWPLLNVNKYHKVIAAIMFLILYEILINLLYPYKTMYNHPLFFIQFILFNGEHLSPIVGFFPFFIIGAFFGDVIYENYLSRDIELPNYTYIRKVLFPLIISGISLILIAFFLIPPGIIVADVSFLFSARSLSWLLYSMGALILFYTSLLLIEKINILNINKKYRFVYYFSYYSLSIFLLHYVLDIFYSPVFNFWNALIVWSFTTLGVGLVAKGIYETLGKYFSLKYQIGIAANFLSDKIYKEELSIVPQKVTEFPVITKPKREEKII